MGKLIDLTSQRFGRLVVQYRNGSKNGKPLWHCLCDCGNEVDVMGSSLRSGATISCGCYNKERIGKVNFQDLTGQKFGRLLVIEKAQKEKAKQAAYWTCQCECGNIVEVRSTNLRNGSTQSCGCLRKDRAFETNFKDLTGQKFGQLTVQSLKGKENDFIWHCLCDCGNEVDVKGKNLKSGTTLSCGCLKIQKLHERAEDLTGKQFEKLTVIERDLSQQGGCYWKCQCECGNFTLVRSKNLRSGAVISCGCVKSKGEQKIGLLLNELEISYNKQHIFPDLVGNKNKSLFFDFYIPLLKICIEYQGQQHYESVDFFGGEEKFIIQKKYDELKRAYCKQHNIKLIEIPYWEYNSINKEYLIRLIYDK